MESSSLKKPSPEGISLSQGPFLSLVGLPWQSPGREGLSVPWVSLLRLQSQPAAVLRPPQSSGAEGLGGKL